MGFHYLPATETEKTAVNAHKDNSLCTLVFENEVEGLEFLKDGKWIPIDPIPHSLVINVGDAHQVNCVHYLRTLKNFMIS
ncbi:Protein DMR6-LIKE OXYGENASE 2 [Linum perenne]